MLSAHPSFALEYWFFKVNSGPIALIVDWIARRRVNQHWLRVSIHSPYKREVLFEKQIDFMPEENFLSHSALLDSSRMWHGSWTLIPAVIGSNLTYSQPGYYA